MSLAALEAKITGLWKDLDGEAKAGIQQALNDAREEEADIAAQVKQAVAAAKADIGELLQRSLTENIGSRVEALEAEVARILEGAVRE